MDYRSYLQESIKGLEIALESADTPEEIRHIRKQIADLKEALRELEDGLD
jgi:ribosomal protein L29